MLAKSLQVILSCYFSATSFGHQSTLIEIMEHTWGTIWNISDARDQPGQSFYETPGGKYGIGFYNIDEYGMMKFFSPVRIWTNKLEPKFCSILRTSGSNISLIEAFVT